MTVFLRDRASFLLSIVLILSVSACTQEELQLLDQQEDVQPGIQTTGFTPEIAPMNPEFLRYMEMVRAGEWEMPVVDGHYLGYIPDPMYVEPDPGRVDGAVSKQLPSSYDLRSEGLLTPVKDQLGCGSCWTFSNMASVESIFMPSDVLDFSENNL